MKVLLGIAIMAAAFGGGSAFAKSDGCRLATRKPPSQASEANRIIQRLEAIPMAGGGNAKVYRLTTELIAFRPSSSLRFLKLGVSRLAPGASNVSTVYLMEKYAFDKIQSSGIAEKRKRQSEEEIGRYINSLIPRGPY